MKKAIKFLKEYLNHTFLHQWVYQCGEGPFEFYTCDKCDKTKIVNYL